ncbi:MAG TPA: site-specific integrase [Chloroflexota bacterium]|nr:site-specific integrase [Chloroflexota bacterium]
MRVEASRAGIAHQLPLPSAPASEGRPPPPRSPEPPRQLADAVRAYSFYLADAGRATHTVRSTELDLNGLLEHLGDVPLADLSPGQVAEHVRWLRTVRHNGTSSLRRKIATLKTFFRYAVEASWLVSSPAEGIPYPPLKRSAMVVLTDTEIEAVVQAASHDPAWHALLLLLADAGLKRDEVLALQAEDLYLAREPSDSRVTVRHTSQAKRARRRSVPLTPRTHFALARLLKAPLPGGLLFSISVRGVNFVVETAGRRAGITRLKKLTPEMLRDTFAVRQMRRRIEEETAASVRGATPRELERLRARHDEQVLQMLGLSRYSEMAARYRAAAVEDSAASGPSSRPSAAGTSGPSSAKLAPDRPGTRR